VAFLILLCVCVCVCVKSLYMIWCSDLVMLVFSWGKKSTSWNIIIISISWKVFDTHEQEKDMHTKARLIIFYITYYLKAAALLLNALERQRVSSLHEPCFLSLHKKKGTLLSFLVWPVSGTHDALHWFRFVPQDSMYSKSKPLSAALLPIIQRG
jgi:hypothetical protein